MHDPSPCAPHRAQTCITTSTPHVVAQPPPSPIYVPGRTAMVLSPCQHQPPGLAGLSLATACITCWVFSGEPCPLPATYACPGWPPCRSVSAACVTPRSCQGWRTSVNTCSSTAVKSTLSRTSTAGAASSHTHGWQYEAAAALSSDPVSICCRLWLWGHHWQVPQPALVTPVPASGVAAQVHF